MKKQKALFTLDQLIEKEYGKTGTKTREKFEDGYPKFKKNAGLNKV